MAESQQTFVLVGNFKDNITPKLRKLDTQIGALTKTFSKFSGTLRPISKELGVMAMAAERLANTQKASRGVFDGNVRALREYKRVLGQAASASDALNRRTPRSLPVPGAPRAPRGGGGGGGLPAAAAMVAGERTGDKGVGFWGMTGAMALANMGVQAATAGFHKLTSSINGFVMGGSQAEQAVIQMAGTLQTLGKVGDFTKSRELADKMMGDLGKVAAKLPGSTEDYLTILQQTLDDQIQAFGSVENVQKNLQGLDPKTGERLAGGMEQSFTALFGMAAQLAGLRPQIAAMDLNQLRQSPENIRNVQLLTRNPTLAKFYQEELKKSGGDFILALNNAMKKAITPEQIDALKNSFDASFQAFNTLFSDKYGGIFGPMRKVKVSVRDAAGNLTTETLSAMDVIGKIMRSINEAATAVWSLIEGTGLDPMVMLVTALDEIGYQIYKYANLIMIMVDKIKSGDMQWTNLVELIGNAIGEAIANFSNWLLNLDYEKFFQVIDKLVYSFFKGLFEGFFKAFKGKAADKKGPLGGLGTSVTGTIVTLLALGKALKVLTAVVTGVTAAVGAIQFSTFAATIAGWAPAIVGGIQAIGAGVATFATTMALPLAAVVGAILGTVAILRHGDFILSSLWEAIKLIGNAFMWLYHGIQEFQTMLMAGLMRFLSKLPLVGHFFKGAAEKLEEERLKQQQHRIDREKAMAGNVDKIGQNTRDSWKRTTEDATKLRNAFSGTTEAAKGANQALAAAAKPAQAAKPRTKADTIGGGGQGGGRGSGARPSTTPAAPRPAAPAPAAAPKPQAPVNLAPAATTALQTAVTNGVKAGQAAQASTWQQALAPISAGITSVASQMVAGFNAARALAAGAKAEAKVHAQNHAKLLNSVIISSNGTKSAVMAVSSKVATQATQAQVESNTAKALILLAQINTSVKSSGMMGGMMPGGFSPPLGGAQGNLGAAARMASASGLQVTSSFRPGDKGYHGVGRAMDFSNSTGPTPQMMAFAQRMIAQYGSSLTELIYSPLGFSIKNGRKVAPLAYGSHFNHVHVAFARGLNSPTMFSSATAAAQYERMMAPAGAKVATVTANSSEYNGSGHTTVNQNITINGAQDPQRLAEIVFDYASRAAQRVNNASFA